jgi:hypothetical protein
MSATNPFMLFLKASMEQKAQVALLLPYREVQGVVEQVDSRMVELSIGDERVMVRAETIEGVRWDPNTLLLKGEGTVGAPIALNEKGPGR